MQEDTSETVRWIVTFGIGGPHRGKYTAVELPSEMTHLAQYARVRELAVESYGRNWAFCYPPEKAVTVIVKHRLQLREVLS